MKWSEILNLVGSIASGIGTGFTIWVWLQVRKLKNIYEAILGLPTLKKELQKLYLEYSNLWRSGNFHDSALKLELIVSRLIEAKSLALEKSTLQKIDECLELSKTSEMKWLIIPTPNPLTKERYNQIDNKLVVVLDKLSLEQRSLHRRRTQ